MKKLSLLLVIVLLLSSVPCMAESDSFLEPYKRLFKKSGRLDLLLAEDALWDFSGENMLSTVGWESLTLDEATAATHPELAAALDEMNRSRTESSEALFGELNTLARDIFGEDGGDGYCSGSFDYYVQRADNTVLSFRSDSDVYWGGAHPDYGTAGINLDPDTGEEIALSDVVLDTYVLTTLLARRLQEKYPEVTFGSDLEIRLLSLKEDEFEWTLGYEGITFYFNPYVILPYAAGKPTATIWFDEAKELFNPDYLPLGSQAYAVKLPLFEEVEFDLNPGDSNRDIIQISGLMGEYEAYEQLWLTINGTAYTYDIYAYSINAYLAMTGTGDDRNCFLYLESIGDSDYPTLTVYNLIGGFPEKICELSGSDFSGGTYSGKTVFTDPGSFRLDTRMDILGTRFGSREYSVDLDWGMPVPHQDYYDIENYGIPLVSMIPLEVFNLNAKTQQNLPAGTEFYAIRTDGETYMDFRLTDGIECRIGIDTSGYPDLINGIPEDECFEGIMYAG